MNPFNSILLAALAALTLPCGAAGEEQPDSLGNIKLKSVTVTGRSGSQKLRQEALTVSAVDVRAAVNRLTTVNDIVGRVAGVSLRREGGVGSDYDIMINGLSGNSIRYFIDGVPIDSRGSSASLDNLPLNTVNRIEIYKGVVPSYLGSDALGGAVNIVTYQRRQNYLDASYGIGSFHTHTADLTGQYNPKGTALVIRPTFSVSYSKNDYMMRDVRVWDEEADRYVETDCRRFHDGYLSVFGQLEAGFNNVSWADAFFLTASFGKVNKDIQTGAIQTKVYGMAERHSRTWNVGLRYAKRWGSVNTRLNVSRTWDRSETVDTALRKYSWDGTWIPANGNEINGRGRQLRVYFRPLTLVNAGVDYDITSAHNIALNYSLDSRGNRQHDDADATYEPTRDALSKHIVALTYSQKFVDDRLSNTFFVKDYINSLTRKSGERVSSTKSYWGAGLGSRFTFADIVQLKGSYEHSVRLPLSRELLGNGTTVDPNLDLRPESSNNYNLGVFGNRVFGGEHTVGYEAGGFIRSVHDYIRAVVSERDGLMQYSNEPAIKVKGAELELSYMWRDRLSLTFNGTWSEARDCRRYKTDGNPSATYNNRVPNRPWLQVNGEAAYNFRDLSWMDDRLRIAWTWQWIHWYYLNWEAFGAVESKAVIPTQNISGLSLTYSWLDGRYNVTAECNNIFDCAAYDNYMLQKPGRSFMAKFRIFID